MKSIRDFIVHIPQEFKGHFITENGVKIYADSRFTQQRTANTIVEVIETPFECEIEIKAGDKLLIDCSAFIRQEHIKTGIHESHHLVDREKRLFKINPQLVIAYSQGEGTKWIGFNDNFLVERPKPKTEKIFQSNLLIAPEKVKQEKGIGSVIVLNETLKGLEVKENDTIYFKEQGAIDIYVEDKPFVWLKNRHALGVYL